MLNWYALYTKPRKEQKVAQQLEELGFVVYLPLKVEVKQWSDRKKKVISPLFSSYVFIQIMRLNSCGMKLKSLIVRFL